MTCAPKCLPPKGQKLFFPGTGGPILIIGEGRAPAASCLPVRLPQCGAPAPVCRAPQGTVVFFGPPPLVPPPGPGPRPQPNPPPVPPSPGPPDPPDTTYYNTEQTCINECPDGTTGEPIFVTVAADTYSSMVSQAEADAIAMDAACAEAAALREETPCIPDDNPWGDCEAPGPMVIYSEPFNGDWAVSHAQGDFIANITGTLGPGQVNLWAVMQVPWNVSCGFWFRWQYTITSGDSPPDVTGVTNPFSTWAYINAPTYSNPFYWTTGAAPFAFTTPGVGSVAITFQFDSYLNPHFP